MADLLIAKTSAVVHLGQRRWRIHKGVTVVRADDPMVKGREHLFRPYEVRLVEQATAAPGELRNVSLPDKPRRTRKAAEE